MGWELYRDGDRLHVIAAGSLKTEGLPRGVLVQADWIAELDPDVSGHGEEETWRHARLIAAAPDLLAACESVARIWDEFMSNDGCAELVDYPIDRAVHAMRLAILKAKRGDA